MFSLLEGKTGMIAPKQYRRKQRVLFEFLLMEGETAHKQKQKDKASVW